MVARDKLVAPGNDEMKVPALGTQSEVLKQANMRCGRLPHSRSTANLARRQMEPCARTTKTTSEQSLEWQGKFVMMNAVVVFHTCHTQSGVGDGRCVST
jgi:hypothetical protein